MGFSVVHGGYIRRSETVSASETTYWTKGRLLTIDSAGQVRVYSNTVAAGVGIVGVALENRVSSTNIGPTTTVTKTGAPSGEKATMMFDYAFITQSQNIESGIQITPGAALYAATDGMVTTSGNGTGSNDPIIGVAFNRANANDTNMELNWLFGGNIGY